MEKHKRFIVFEYTQYYPSGGLTDIALETDESDEVLRFFKDNSLDGCLYDILDMDNKASYDLYEFELAIIQETQSLQTSKPLP